MEYKDEYIRFKLKDIFTFYAFQSINYFEFEYYNLLEDCRL